ncbi:fatty acid 2-hydroxylase-like [Clavelina lepadiformis]|uniref:fatty acid 2-hydroxylase-like n=1 Tax=Clavelina lepadiformis TaxID=159417 RepID=UPI004043816A
MPSLRDQDIAKVSPDERTLVIHKKKVYDVSKFVNVHPGGQKILKLRHGKDITNIMQNGPHEHSRNAYRWLEQYYVADYQNDTHDISTNISDGVGVTRIGHILHEEEKYTANKKADLINWDEPVLWQVGHMGAKYHDWVDDPVDRPLRLFKNNFVEFFSNTPWYVIPMFWLPIIVMFVLKSYSSFSSSEIFLFSMFRAFQLPFLAMPVLFLFGMLSWTFVEYALHRWLFHRDPPTTSYFLITLHFLLHGQHHKVPFDSGRLVFPPAAASVLLVIFYSLFRLFFVGAVVDIFVAGLVLGYVCYDLTHYYLHYGSPKKGGYFDRLRAYHVRHHFESPNLGFGISSKLWDYPFNTCIQMRKRKKDN